MASHGYPRVSMRAGMGEQTTNSTTPAAPRRPTPASQTHALHPTPPSRTAKAAAMKCSMSGRSSRGSADSRGARRAELASAPVGTDTVRTLSQFSSICIRVGWGGVRWGVVECWRRVSRGKACGMCATAPADQGGCLQPKALPYFLSVTRTSMPPNSENEIV